MEAEGAEVARASDGLAVPARADRVRGVLDDRDPVAHAEPGELVDVDGPAAEVHRDERARARSREVVGVREVDEPRPRVAVDEDRRRAAMLDDVCAGGERVGRDEHLVAGSDVEEHEGERHPGGARVQAAHERRLDVVRQQLLEPRDLRPARQPAGAQGVEDLLDLGRAEIRARDAEEAVGPARAHRTVTVLVTVTPRGDMTRSS